MSASFRLAQIAVALVIVVSLAGCGRDGPSGTYQAKAPAGEQGSMILEFQEGSKVKLIMTDGSAARMEFTCDYTVEGDSVSIRPPMGAPGAGDNLVLTRKGDSYQTSMFGEQLVFEKQ
jgi:hypothetical protein